MPGEQGGESSTERAVREISTPITRDVLPPEPSPTEPQLGPQLEKAASEGLKVSKLRRLDKRFFGSGHNT